MKPIAVAGLLLLSPLLGGAALAVPGFTPRPSEPYECAGLLASGAAGIWEGYFHGRKETEIPGFRYETANRRLCFKSETACRNWLYNMLSEYDNFVWSANCKKVSGQ